MFNNVTLIGYFGSDAESRTTRNNTAMTVLSVATKRTWKNRETGERESQTTGHRCVTFGRTAEYAATFTVISCPLSRLQIMQIRLPPSGIDGILIVVSREF